MRCSLKIQITVLLTFIVCACEPGSNVKKESFEKEVAEQKAKSVNSLNLVSETSQRLNFIQGAWEVVDSNSNKIVQILADTFNGESLFHLNVYNRRGELIYDLNLYDGIRADEFDLSSLRKVNSENGYVLYNKHCTMGCHNLTKRAIGPALQSVASKKTVEEFINSYLNKSEHRLNTALDKRDINAIYLAAIKGDQVVP